jgi:hypothetical protein
MSEEPVQPGRPEVLHWCGSVEGIHQMLDDVESDALSRAAELLRGMHAAVYNDAGERVARGLLMAADRLAEWAVSPSLLRPEENPS